MPCVRYKGIRATPITVTAASRRPADEAVTGDGELHAIASETEHGGLFSNSSRKAQMRLCPSAAGSSSGVPLPASCAGAPVGGALPHGDCCAPCPEAAEGSEA